MSEVPNAVITYLLDNLAKIAISNYHLYVDVADNAKELEGEIEKLIGLKQDFGRYNQDSRYLRILNSNISETVDKASKAVASYVDFVERHMKKEGFSKALHKLYFSRRIRKKSKKISEALQKVKDLNETSIPKGIEILKQQSAGQLGQRANTVEPRIVEEEHVIGFEKESGDLMKLIMGGAENFELIAIVGMIGLGKSTLAKKVLRDLNGNRYIRAFVNVSKECEKKKILIQILSGIKKLNNEVSNMSEDMLKMHLYEQLQLEYKMFVIVLDDVWRKRDLEWLKGAFPRKKGCRVLITTCHNKVVEHTETRIYELGRFQMDDSLKLLSRKVFGGSKSTIEDSEEFKLIAEKCDGLPLSIEAVADALPECGDVHVSHPWKRVALNVNHYALRNKTKKPLNERYLTLKQELQLCFIYLGVFPEGFEIEVRKLVRLWIAEGLIKEKDDPAMEEKAEKYLQKLVRKNLVIIEKRRLNGNAKTIRLQRMVHEFCRIKAGEEKLFHEISQLVNEHSGILDLNDCYRLCINKIIDNIKYNHAEHLLSVIAIPDVSPDVEPTLPPEFLSSIPAKFRNLKVLEIQPHVPTNSSGEFSRLDLLRYMAISSDFKVFPWGTVNMEHIQTLMIKTKFPTLELNSSELAMPNLKHLHTNVPTKISPHPDAKNPKKKGKALVGKNLQSLSTLAPESCTEDVFDQTPRLEKLVIGGKLIELFKVRASGDKPLLVNLHKLKELRSLKLLNDEPNPDLYILPWEKSIFPQQITRLTLSETWLEWKEMSILGKLERLEVLKLKDNAFRGSVWRSSMDDFRCLKYLHIEDTDLMTWEVSSGDHFPSLKTIKFKNCKQLQEMPRCLRRFPRIQWVVLENTTPFAARSARDVEFIMLQQGKQGNAINGFQLEVSPDY